MGRFSNDLISDFSRPNLPASPITVQKDYVKRSANGRVLKTEMFTKDELGNVVHCITETEGFALKIPRIHLSDRQSGLLVFAGIVVGSAIGAWVLITGINYTVRSIGQQFSEVEEVQRWG